MVPVMLGLALTSVTALLILLADYMLKAAADTGAATLSIPVVAGCALYVASAVVWFVAMRHVPLGQAAVAYSMLSLLGLVGIGVIVFDESFGWREGVGLGFALIAMALILKG